MGVYRQIPAEKRCEKKNCVKNMCVSQRRNAIAAWEGEE